MTGKHTEETKNTLISAHITRDLFCDWQEGKLKMPEEIDLFTHIGACTFCAERFGNWMEGFSEDAEGEEEKGELKTVDFLEEPPQYLKEEILSRTHQIDVQASVKLKETSRQVQLMIYSLKVGFAVAASIFLLTITANIQNMNPEPFPDQQTELRQEQQENREKEESVVGRLRRGSKEITGFLNEISSGLFRIEMNDFENERNQEVTR